MDKNGKEMFDAKPSKLPSFNWTKMGLNTPKAQLKCRELEKAVDTMRVASSFQCRTNPLSENNGNIMKQAEID